MSKSSIRASLIDVLIKWRIRNAEDISDTLGIWLDEEASERNAECWADAVMTCLRAAEVESELETELGEE